MRKRLLLRHWGLKSALAIFAFALFPLSASAADSADSSGATGISPISVVDLMPMKSDQLKDSFEGSLGAYQQLLSEAYKKTAEQDSRVAELKSEDIARLKKVFYRTTANERHDDERRRLILVSLMQKIRGYYNRLHQDQTKDPTEVSELNDEKNRDIRNLHFLYKALGKLAKDQNLSEAQLQELMAKFDPASGDPQQIAQYNKLMDYVGQLLDSNGSQMPTGADKEMSAMLASVLGDQQGGALLASMHDSKLLAEFDARDASTGRSLASVDDTTDGKTRSIKAYEASVDDIANLGDDFDRGVVEEVAYVENFDVQSNPVGPYQSDVVTVAPSTVANVRTDAGGSIVKPDAPVPTDPQYPARAGGTGGGTTSAGTHQTGKLVGDASTPPGGSPASAGPALKPEPNAEPRPETPQPSAKTKQPTAETPKAPSKAAPTLSDDCLLRGVNCSETPTATSTARRTPAQASALKNFGEASSAENLQRMFETASKTEEIAKNPSASHELAEAYIRSLNSLPQTTRPVVSACDSGQKSEPEDVVRKLSIIDSRRAKTGPALAHPSVLCEEYLSARNSNNAETWDASLATSFRAFGRGPGVFCPDGPDKRIVLAELGFNPEEWVKKFGVTSEVLTACFGRPAEGAPSLTTKWRFSIDDILYNDECRKRLSNKALDEVRNYKAQINLMVPNLLLGTKITVKDGRCEVSDVISNSQTGCSELGADHANMMRSSMLKLIDDMARSDEAAAMTMDKNDRNEAIFATPANRDIAPKANAYIVEQRSSNVEALNFIGDSLYADLSGSTKDRRALNVVKRQIMQCLGADQMGGLLHPMLMEHQRLHNQHCVSNASPSTRVRVDYAGFGEPKSASWSPDQSVACSELAYRKNALVAIILLQCKDVRAFQKDPKKYQDSGSKEPSAALISYCKEAFDSTSGLEASEEQCGFRTHGVGGGSGEACPAP